MMTEEDLRRAAANWQGYRAIASEFNFKTYEQIEALEILIEMYGTFILLSDVTNIAQDIQTPTQLQALFILGEYDMSMAVSIRTPYQLEALKLILMHNDEQAELSLRFTCESQVTSLKLLLGSAAILERCTFEEIIDFALFFNNDDILSSLMHLADAIPLTYNSIIDLIDISSWQEAAGEEDLYEEDPYYLQHKEEDYFAHVYGQMPYDFANPWMSG